eukprot:jgi/Picre1/31645/NNA_006996.t1
MMARGRQSCQIVATLVLLSLQACFAAKKKEDATLGLIELDEANFLGTVTELALEYDWVLIEFYSHWCPACKAFQPDYKKIATHVFNVMGEEEKAWRESWMGNLPLWLPKDDQGEVSVDGEHVHQESDIVIPKTEDDRKVTVHPKHADRVDIIGATVLSFEYLGSSALLKGPDARRALSRWLHLLASSHPVKECAMGADAALVSLNKVWDKSSQEIQDLDMFRRLKICGGLTREPWNQCAGSTSGLEDILVVSGCFSILYLVRMPEKNGSRSGRNGWMLLGVLYNIFFSAVIVPNTF